MGDHGAGDHRLPRAGWCDQDPQLMIRESRERRSLVIAQPRVNPNFCGSPSARSSASSRMLARAGARELTLDPVPTPCRSGRVCRAARCRREISRYPAGIAGYGPGWGAAPDWAGGRRGGTLVELGIDLGTANTVVSDVRHGIVLDEPSVMLLRHGGGRRERVLAVGRTRPSCSAAPLPSSSRSDRCTTVWSRTWRRPGCTCARCCRRRTAGWWAGPVRAVVGVPVGSTALERRALLEAAEEAGSAR